MNDRDKTHNRHDAKPIWRAASGVAITLASAELLRPQDDEPAQEPLKRFTPAPTVVVSSVPTVRGSSVAFRFADLKGQAGPPNEGHD